MMMMSSERTPCEVLFDTMKRRLGMPHKDLAACLLSNRPLSDGRSPVEHAKDRSWLSHVIVHAPVGAQQDRYFGDYGMAAERIMGWLASDGRRTTGAEGVLRVLSGQASSDMQGALAICRQDPNLYANSLGRVLSQVGMTPREKAQEAMVLFVAAGCSASSRRATEYLGAYQEESRGATSITPPTRLVEQAVDVRDGEEEPSTLGVVRLSDGCVRGQIHWALPRNVEPDGDAASGAPSLTIGALATGETSVTDVGVDVSAEHARIWRAQNGRWLVEDLGSTNGTSLTSALDGEEHVLSPFESREVGPGDELRLGGETRFVVVRGRA